MGILFYVFQILAIQATPQCVIPLAGCCCIPLAAALAVLRYADEDKLPLSATIPIALYGFLIAVTWIDTIAGRLVELLQFGGILLGIPPPVLGCTVLAWSNSMGDLSANLAMARKGLPDASCFGCQRHCLPTFAMLILLHTSFLPRWLPLVVSPAQPSTC